MSISITTDIARPPMGEFRLFVPPDWFDLMADGNDRDATRRRCEAMVRLSYPNTPEPRRQEFTDVLLDCYDRYFGDGVVMYGVLTAPLPSTGAPAAWQVWGGLVDVPRQPGELDLGVLMEKVFDEQFAGTAPYVEKFETAMGLGFGFLSQPSVPRLEGAGETPQQDRRTGLAGVLSCPPEGGKGLLVIGTCLDPHQVRELAGLIAVIAGESEFTFTPTGTPVGQDRVGREEGERT